jgi:4-amino-4-deoxy-L-arabinose transferase-like glycosyltransferase
MFSLENEEKRIKQSLFIILALFFIINLGVVIKYGSGNFLGSIEKMDNDDVKYIRSAWTLMDTGKFTYHKVDEPTVYIMPGLTFVLSFFMLIFGKTNGVLAFRIFQVILQTLSIYLLFLIGRKLFNSKIAIVACVLNSLYVAEYFVSTIILTESIFKFLLLLLVYISIYAVEEKKTLYYILGGLVWGITCLFRPTIAAYPIVILIMWLVKKYSFKDMVKYTLITSAVFCVILSPWWIRNYKVYDRFIALTLSTGNPFLQGTYVNYDQTKDYTPYKSRDTVIETNEVEIETGIYRLKTYARKEPLKYLYWYTIGKTIKLWNMPFYWVEVLGVSFVSAEVFHLLIIGTGLYGIIRAFKKKDMDYLVAFLVIAYFNVMHLPYYTFSRYSYPVMPLVMLFSSYVIVNRYSKERKTA